MARDPNVGAVTEHSGSAGTEGFATVTAWEEREELSGAEIASDNVKAANTGLEVGYARSSEVDLPDVLSEELIWEDGGVVARQREKAVRDAVAIGVAEGLGFAVQTDDVADARGAVRVVVNCPNLIVSEQQR